MIKQKIVLGSKDTSPLTKEEAVEFKKALAIFADYKTTEALLKEKKKDADGSRPLIVANLGALV